MEAPSGETRGGIRPASSNRRSSSSNNNTATTSSSSSPATATTVYLNIYDLMPSGSHNWAYSLGLGMHHSGVEVYGKEYGFFGHTGPGTGIISTTPRLIEPPARFRESIAMGEVTLSCNEVKKIIEEMASQFLGKRYHLTDFNCNAFSDALCRRLLSKPIPTWVNRLAYLGSFVKDLLPGSLIQPPADAVQVVQEQSSKKITFTGVGRTLSDNQSTTRGGIRADLRGSPKTARKSSTTIISVDDNAPSTRIQVWFPKGNKVQQRFNLVHTVADIYSFVDGMEPEYKGRYKLFMVYPRQELLDRKLTLDEAYLINASIIVELLS